MLQLTRRLRFQIDTPATQYSNVETAFQISTSDHTRVCSHKIPKMHKPTTTTSLLEHAFLCDRTKDNYNSPSIMARLLLLCICIAVSTLCFASSPIVQSAEPRTGVRGQPEEPRTDVRDTTDSKKEGTGSDFSIKTSPLVSSILKKVFYSESIFLNRFISLPIGVSILLSWRK